MLSSVTGVVNIALTSKLWRLDPLSAMTFIKNWEDFERSAEKLYLANPMKVTISAHGARKEQIINKISSAPKLPV